MYLNMFFPFGVWYIWASWWLRWWRILLQCRRPWVGKIPCRRKWQSIPAFLPGEFHGQRSLLGSSPQDQKELDMTEQLSMNTQLALSLVLWKYTSFELLKCSSISFSLLSMRLISHYDYFYWSYRIRNMRNNQYKFTVHIKWQKRDNMDVNFPNRIFQFCNYQHKLHYKISETVYLVARDLQG